MNRLIFLLLIILTASCELSCSPEGVFSPIPSYGSDLQLYAIELNKDSISLIPLGTQIRNSYALTTTKDELTFKFDEDTVHLKYEILNDDLLTIHFDSRNQIRYKRIIQQDQRNQTQLINKTLTSGYWSREHTDLIYEFYDSLKNNYISGKFSKELKSATFHLTKGISDPYDYQEITWGIHYQNGLNILSLQKQSSYLNSEYFIVNNVNDSTITGMQFDEQGDTIKAKFTHHPTNSTTPVLLLGKWQMSSSVKQESEFESIISDFEPMKTIHENDLEALKINMTLTEDSFRINRNDVPIQSGTWGFDRSGTNLTFRNIQDGEFQFSNSAKVMSITDSTLTMVKKEYIEIGINEYVEKDYTETFRKVVE